MSRTRGKAGNYQAPIDTVGMDEEMKRTLGASKRAPEPNTAPRAAPRAARPTAVNVGTPGNRPLTTSKNLEAVQGEIERQKSVNEGARIMKRREGQLRNPRR